VTGTAEVRSAILADCLARRPDEAVGVVLVGGLGPPEVVPLPNALPGPASRAAFAVAPRDWMAVERRALDAGRAIGALYHAHPRGPLALSRADLAFATPGGAPLSDGLELWLVGPDSGGILNQIVVFSFVRGQWRRASPCSFG
jgi:proteasome lid subunit RPN8/RPN11